MWMMHKDEILGGWMLSNGDFSLDLTTQEVRTLKTGDRTSVSGLLRRKLGRVPPEKALLEIRSAAGGHPFCE